MGPVVRRPPEPSVNDQDEGSRTACGQPLVDDLVGVRAVGHRVVGVRCGTCEHLEAHAGSAVTTGRQSTGLDRTMVLDGGPYSASRSMSASKAAMAGTATISTQHAFPVTRWSC